MQKFDVLYQVARSESELRYGEKPLDLFQLVKNYRALVRGENANNLEHLFFKMQGEVWSPNGEARGLISSLGLSHTSMSVGDIAIDSGGVMWFCDLMGFSKIELMTVSV